MITSSDLINEYGRKIYGRQAALFVGAGISIGAGYPNWDELLESIRDAADVPSSVKDAPLAAEFAAQTLLRANFNKRLLERLTDTKPKATPVFWKLLRLPVQEYWTTNYDNLLESAASGYERITRDDDYALVHERADKRITKMHGSLSLKSPVVWESDPVITRGDFERYELTHPLIWSQLRAQFLTSSFLFLGLSFNDPNVEVLLRLSRSLDRQVVRHQHYAVLKSDPEHNRELDLRVQDLERSGISVALVDEFEEIDGLVEALYRRAQQPYLFVSGSGIEGDESAKRVCDTIGSWLSAVTNLTLTSLAGEVGLRISEGFNKGLRASEYDAERIKFYFRDKRDSAPPQNLKRTGTCIYTRLQTEELREHVLADARAMLVVGGGERTEKEIALAVKQGIPVIPVACTPGAAARAWEGRKPGDLNLDGLVDDEEWSRLAVSDENIVARTVQSVVKAVMSLD